MSRPLRLEFPGSLWHITVRGNERRNIFADNADRLTLLELLSSCVARFEWIVPSYALMPNHFHLVVQLTAETLSRGMQWLNGSYAQRFNRRHERVGHLFQGRFKAFLIDKESYWLEVLRYVVLNPVRAGIVSRPEEYAWSSHCAILGMVEAPKWLAVDDVLAPFGPTREIARPHYRAFVDAGIQESRKPWADLVGQIFLGSETWIENVRNRVALEPRASEIPRSQRQIGQPTMSDVIAAVASIWSTPEDRIRKRRGGLPRMVAAWIGCHEAHLTNGEIAAGLRLRSSGWVSDLVRSCERSLCGNKRLRRTVDRCVSTMRRNYCEPKT